MMSVNQMAVYHIIMECNNIVRNSASEQIKSKWTNINKEIYSLRSVQNEDLKVPDKPKLKSRGFTYHAAKLYNMLPKSVIKLRTFHYLRLWLRSGFGRKSHHNNYIDTYIRLVIYYLLSLTLLFESVKKSFLCTYGWGNTYHIYHLSVFAPNMMVKSPSFWARSLTNLKLDPRVTCRFKNINF